MNVTLRFAVAGAGFSKELISSAAAIYYNVAISVAVNPI